MKKDSIATKRDYQSLVKHNNLIRGKYTLEASEQKLLYKLFEHVQKNNYTTRELNLSFVDFYREFKGVLNKNISKADFKNLVEGLQDKIPYIIRGDKFVRTQWYKIVGDIDYNEICLILEEEVFQYIQIQEKNFTMLRLETVYSFKKFHTMRIYELLKQWSNTKKVVTLSIEELKKYLDIEDNTGYKNFSNIKKYILNPATKEINDKSELTISYDLIKEGRKVVAIDFNILDQLPAFKYPKTEKKKIETAKEKSQTEEIILTEVDDILNDAEGNKIPVKQKCFDVEAIQEQQGKQLTAEEVKPALQGCKYPDFTILNKPALRMLNIYFKGMDFTQGELFDAFIKAENKTMEKDDKDIIDVNSFSYFKTILEGEIADIEFRKKEQDRVNLECDLYGGWE